MGKTKEVQKPHAEAGAAPAPSAAAKPHDAAADHKKAKPEAPSASKGKKHEPIAGNCFSWGCKAHAARFNFCDEHYEHFKFGLIKKTGEQVSDYEKKIEHYLAYKAKQKSAHKAA
jgi:hypothetical protein